MASELLNTQSMIDYNTEEEQAFIQVRLRLLTSPRLLTRPKLTVTPTRRLQELSKVTLGWRQPDRAPTLSPLPQEDTDTRMEEESTAAQDGAVQPEEVEDILRKSLEVLGQPEGTKAPTSAPSTREEALKSIKIPRSTAATRSTPELSPAPTVTSTLDLTEDTIDWDRALPDFTPTPVPLPRKGMPQHKRNNSLYNRPPPPVNSVSPEAAMNALMISALDRLSRAPDGARALRQAQESYEITHKPRRQRAGKASASNEHPSSDASHRASLLEASQLELERRQQSTLEYVDAIRREQLDSRAAVDAIRHEQLASRSANIDEFNRLMSIMRGMSDHLVRMNEHMQSFVAHSAHTAVSSTPPSVTLSAPADDVAFHAQQPEVPSPLRHEPPHLSGGAVSVATRNSRRGPHFLEPTPVASLATSSSTTSEPIIGTPATTRTMSRAPRPSLPIGHISTDENPIVQTSVDEYLENPEKLSFRERMQLVPKIEEYPSWNGEASKLLSYLREMDIFIRVNHLPENLLLTKFRARLTGDAQRYYQMCVLEDDAPCSWEAWKTTFRERFLGTTWQREQQERYMSFRYRGQEPLKWFEEFVEAVRTIHANVTATEILEALVSRVPPQMSMNLKTQCNSAGQLSLSKLMQIFEEIASVQYPHGFHIA
ncbi:hypothetical protein JCM5296_000532 [Sporobolomyces johnsonii]